MLRRHRETHVRFCKRTRIFLSISAAFPTSCVRECQPKVKRLMDKSRSGERIGRRLSTWIRATASERFRAQRAQSRTGKRSMGTKVARLSESCPSPRSTSEGRCSQLPADLSTKQETLPHANSRHTTSPAAHLIGRVAVLFVMCRVMADQHIGISLL